MRAGLLLLMTLCPGIPADVDPVVQDMHDAAQEWRGRYGLFGQVLDADLCDLAQQHAEWMAATGRYDHGSWDQVIHRGPVTARGAVSGWIRSGPHAAWLLGGNRRAGWGHAVGLGGHYWVGVFR
jgi:hypothetical protein